MAITPLPAEPPIPGNFNSPEFYLNRELSWLAFNRRVLHEAEDERTPLLERVRFLGIFAANLDEFFQVRVAGLKQQVAAKYLEPTADGMTAEEQLRAIAAEVRSQLTAQSHCLHNSVLPELARHGVVLYLNWHDVPEGDRKFLTEYFHSQVFPVLTPLLVDPAHPFPYISNLSISLAVSLRDPQGDEHFARVKIPEILPRWVPLPGPTRLVPLEMVIRAHLAALFPGVDILGSWGFRITRNTDLDIDTDDADDLLSLIQEEVQNRRFAEVVRLELEEGTPTEITALLLEELNADQVAEGVLLTQEDVYEIPGLMDSADLSSLASLDLPTLKYPPHSPVIPARLQNTRSIFEIINEEDLLVHHPYESFPATVERFLESAALDPNVVAIKATLYRTGKDSSLPKLLTRAATQGKQVAVLVELQARFDEESNIEWAQRFEDAGVHVSYGVSGLKTHTKIVLVVRREGNEMRRYVHIGTGNYAPGTARLYTDVGLFSCHPDLGADLSDLFNVLTGLAHPPGYRKLLVAPNNMRRQIISLIRREANLARQGRPARLIAKMNSLVDSEIIAELYRASEAGVIIDLIIRGICCLRPGVPQISSRIRVISIVGRFLEHSRIWYFDNGGDSEVYIGSADWMPRNLDRRIEAVTPVLEGEHRNLLLETLQTMWCDNRQAWELDSTGRWTQRHPQPGEPERGTHALMIERYRSLAHSHVNEPAQPALQIL